MLVERSVLHGAAGFRCACFMGGMRVAAIGRDPGVVVCVGAGDLNMGEGAGDKQHTPERQQISAECSMATAHRLDHGIGFRVYWVLML